MNRPVVSELKFAAAPHLVFGRLPRLAAIDIGTNSIRCIVVEVEPDDSIRVVGDEKAQVRLGEGLYASGKISREAWARAEEALQRMVMIAQGLGVEVVEAVATSAVRQAKNGDRFLREMQKLTGLEIQLISGDEEARLAALSARYNFDLDGSRYAVIDIGGGSVEVVTGIGSHLSEINSLALGAVYLTETFQGSDPLSDQQFKQLRKYVRRELKRKAPGGGLPVSAVIGSGGTLTNIGSMVMAMRGEKFDSVHRYEVLRSEVVHLLAMLRRKDLKGREATPGLDPARADIIVAGITVTNELLRHFGCNLLRINHKGIREGLILASLEKHGLIATRFPQVDWRASVEQFARSCHFDEEHSRHVWMLAQGIFNELAGEFGLGETEARLLEAAALLHDVGYFINYDQHHKHSYHLIRHANLFGFTPREQELVANIARYHRKAPPKKKHENFARLLPPDQELVRKLGGILRLADGLDRCRTGRVRKIRCQLNQGRLEIQLLGDGDLSVELYGGQSKGDLFEAAFERELSVLA
ncbi:MAG TPA: Ppx/GppA phosphatase family protein [Geothermobacteraceae bacterium]|nr:Ppx/GppA phosphatase family protein [Geothermobacteraceae bacterium]